MAINKFIHIYIHEIVMKTEDNRNENCNNNDDRNKMSTNNI